MKWFKHLCDSNRSVTIRKINKKYGLEGEARYWRLVEICSEKYECGEPEFTFDPETVRQTLRHRSVTDCRSFVDWLATAQLLIADTSGIVWRIKFPKILEIRDNHTKNLQATKKLVSNNLPLDKEEEKEEEKDKDKEYISSVVGKTTPEQDLMFLFLFNNIKVEVEKNLYEKWIEIYSNEFVTHELKQIETWLMINKHKAPRKDFKRFINNWLNRGWESYRKKLDSKKSIMNFITAVE